MRTSHDIEISRPIEWNWIPFEQVRDDYKVPIGSELIGNPRNSVHRSKEGTVLLTTEH